MDLQRAKAIFTEAAAIASPAARAGYLASACAGDPRLRKQVESLLAAQDQLGGFLEPAAAQVQTEVSEVEGTDIGPYRILQKIGDGGFGIVYMAEQEFPVRRKVALKIIKAGMDSKQVIARFEVERRALAMMDHPNIARVLDAGETGGGRPYFVMELVKGVLITEFCDRKKLSARARLRLFIQVCNAVQHAHQKGIIHRDLKPSNVMITMVDGQPVPKVIDFGVAKAIEQRLTEKTLFTRYDQLIGTPTYMSPEQAEFSGQDVDTRSDIYSLGVLLYELLTSTPPIDSDTMRKAGLDEIRRLIRETDPPNPSKRLQTLGAKLTTVAESRQADPATLCKTVQGDPDWIVMKCLEKDRARRYATASDLAADLQRYLDHEPVTARPPGNLYRLRKFVRRNRLQVIFFGGVSMAILVGLIIALVGFAEARRERDRALAAERQSKVQQQIARTEAARSAQVAQILEQMLRGVGPAAAQGRDTTLLREILDQTVVQLTKDLVDQPEVEADLRSTLGGVYGDLGDFTNAAAMHMEALRLRKEIHGENHLAVAESLYWLADVRQRERQYSEAESLFREALVIRQKLLGPAHRDVAMALNRLAGILRKQGGPKTPEARIKLGEAEHQFKEMLDAQRELPGSDPLAVLFILDRLGLVLSRQEKHTEAEAVTREILSLHKGMGGDNQLGLGSALYRLAAILRHKGKLEEAEAASHEALTLWRKVLPREHPELLQLIRLHAGVLDDLGRFAEAEVLLREVLAIYGKSRVDSWDASVTRGVLGRILLHQKKYAEAEPLLLAAYDGLQRQAVTAVSTQFSEAHRLLKDVQERLVQLYEESGKPEQAVKWKQKLTELKTTAR